MSRLCERSGCRELATASYYVDMRAKSILIESFAPGDDGGRLCGVHADAMRPLKGWTLDDRRDPVPRLFRVPEPSATPVDSTPSRGQRRKVRTTPHPSLLDLVVDDETQSIVRRLPAGAVEAEPDLEETGEMPVADETEEFDVTSEVEDSPTDPMPRELRYERDEEEPWVDADGDPWAEETF